MKNRHCLRDSILVNMGPILKFLKPLVCLDLKKTSSNWGGHMCFVGREKLIPPMDVEYGSQWCLVEQRQMRLVNLMEFWGLPLNSSSSRCLIGPSNVCLVLFEDCNTKNLKQAKKPLHREQRV